MKSVPFILLFCFAASGLSGQTWKLTPVWTDDISATYLSFGYPDDEQAGEGDVFFSLYGFHSYDEDSTDYFEVEYLKATPRGMYEFLKHVKDFSEKYRSEEAVSYIFGVKVKTFRHPLTGNYTCVYGPGGRDFCMFKARRWATVYDSFVEFCRRNNISTD